MKRTGCESERGELETAEFEARFVFSPFFKTNQEFVEVSLNLRRQLCHEDYFKSIEERAMNAGERGTWWQSETISSQILRGIGLRSSRIWGFARSLWQPSEK